MYKLIGERIRRYRKALDLSQDELARRAGISASFLGHIERGTRVLSVDTLLRLCQTLHVTPNDLLCTEGMQRVQELPEDVQPLARELMQSVIDAIRIYCMRDNS